MNSFQPMGTRPVYLLVVQKCTKYDSIYYVFTGRTDVEAETPILWPPDAKSCLIWRAEKDWRQEETGTTEDEIVGWDHWLKEHEFEWTLGVGDGQGGLVCCCKELDKTERLNWTETEARSQKAHWFIFIEINLSETSLGEQSCSEDLKVHLGFVLYLS